MCGAVTATPLRLALREDRESKQGRNPRLPQVDAAGHDGGVDWEGTYVDPVAPNIFSGLLPSILNFADYAVSGFAPDSRARHAPASARAANGMPRIC